MDIVSIPHRGILGVQYLAPRLVRRQVSACKQAYLVNTQAEAPDTRSYMMQKVGKHVK